MDGKSVNWKSILIQILIGAVSGAIAGYFVNKLTKPQDSTKKVKQSAATPTEQVTIPAPPAATTEQG